MASLRGRKNIEGDVTWGAEGRYLGLTGQKEHEDGEDSILRIFVTCIPRQFKPSNEEQRDAQGMLHSLVEKRNSHRVLVGKP